MVSKGITQRFSYCVIFGVLYNVQRLYYDYMATIQHTFAFPVLLGYSPVEVVRSVQHIYSFMEGVNVLGFIVTGRVERVRETTNQTTGEKTTYVEVGDYGMMQEVACTADQARPVTVGVSVQVPVSCRASAFNGQARLNVRALDAFKVAQAASR